MKVSWIVATFLSTAAPIPAAAAAQVGVVPGVPLDSPGRITPDAESFRAVLSAYLAELREVAEVLNESAYARAILSQSRLDVMGAVASAQAQVGRLTARDLARLQARYARNPGWREIPTTLKALLRPEVLDRLRAIPAPQTPDELRGIVPSAVDPATCDPGPGTPLGITDVFIAKGVALAANAFMEGFPTDGLTIAARIAPIAAWAIAEGAVLTLEGLNAVEAECEDARFQQRTDDDLDTNVSSRATQTSVDAVNGKLDARLDTAVSTRASQASLDLAHAKLDVLNAKADQIGGQLDAQSAFLVDFRAQMVRLKIEDNLLNPDNAKISLFQLPQAFGGHLETVRDVVTETIESTLAASLPVYNAAAELARGNAAFAAGRYKEAYDHYGRAYRAAVR